MQKSYYNYRVEFTEDVFASDSCLKEVLQEVSGSEHPRVMLIADANFVNHTAGIGSKIGRYFSEHGISMAASPLLLSGGEKIKADNMQTAQTILRSLMEAQIGTQDVLIIMGGGSLLDVAGYAAAQARGGLNLLKIPTTPAAMMDAAFAKSAALDYSSIKDGVKTSIKTAAVLIQPSFATTILDGVWRGSAGEAVRQALAFDAKLFSRLIELAPKYMARDEAALNEVVRLTVASRLKHGPTTLGEWAALRLESISGYKLPHGYSIAIGILIDAFYAVKAQSFKAEEYKLVFDLLEAFGSLDGMHHSRHLLNQIPAIVSGIDSWRLMHGEESFTLPNAIGEISSPLKLDRELLSIALKEFFEVENAK